MLVSPARRRRTARPSGVPYRPSIPGTGSPTLSPVSLPPAPHSHADSRPPGSPGAALRAPSPHPEPQEHLPPSPKAAARIAAAYEGLAMQHRVLAEANPGLWLQRSIDRAPDADAVLTLLQGYHATQRDIHALEAGLARIPRSLEIANRWVLRLHDSDVDAAITGMCRTAQAKATSRRDKTRYTPRSLQLIPLAALRLSHRSMREALNVDLSGKGLADRHIPHLLPLLGNFANMLFLDLSRNRLTDASAAPLAAVLHAIGLAGLDMRGNALTLAGVHVFNQARGAEDGLLMQADAVAFHTAEPNAAARLEALKKLHTRAFNLSFGTALHVACRLARTGAAAVRALRAEPGMLRRMTYLDLSGKPWEINDLEALAMLIARDGPYLQVLDLSDSRVPAGRMQNLIEALQEALGPGTLRLRGLRMHADDMAATTREGSQQACVEYRTNLGANAMAGAYFCGCRSRGCT